MGVKTTEFKEQKAKSSFAEAEKEMNERLKAAASGETAVAKKAQSEVCASKCAEKKFEEKCSEATEAAEAAKAADDDAIYTVKRQAGKAILAAKDTADRAITAGKKAESEAAELKAKLHD